MSLKNPKLELTSHWGIRILTLLFLALTIYAVADFYLGAYAYAGTPPFAILLAIGIVALLLGLWVGRGAAGAERIPSALLFAAAAAAASYSLLLRVNQATDSDGPQLVNYFYIGHGTYETDRAGYPNLSLARFPQSWLEDHANASHSFEIVHGALGFYQYNQARLQAELRENIPLSELLK